MIEEVERGKPVRLNLQLSDGEESLPRLVKAFLRDENGTLISDYPLGIYLTHVGQGLFKNKEFLMPDSVKEITAQYIVYQQDGVTIDAEYIHSYDKFIPIEISDVGAVAGADEKLEVYFDDISDDIVIDIKETIEEETNIVEAFLDSIEDEIVVTIKDEEEI